MSSGAEVCPWEWVSMMSLPWSICRLAVVRGQEALAVGQEVLAKKHRLVVVERPKRSDQEVEAGPRG